MSRDFIWSEKYRPKSVKDVLLPSKVKQSLLEYVESDEIPHLLFISGAGRGKTTTAKALCHDIGAEYLYINASADNGIDVLRNKIGQFAKTKSLYSNKPKIVILDEFDFATPNFQAALRSPMEEFSKNVRFILTANYEYKIIDALKSRCQTYNFNIDDPTIKKEMIVQVAQRLKDILDKENVQCDGSVLIDLIVKIYPDIRRLINILQKFSSENNGIIDNSVLAYESADEELINFILEKNWTGARKYCLDKNIGNELYSFLYNDLLPKLSNDNNKFAQVLLIIADYQFKSQTVTDIEIPMAACLMSIIGAI
jgi:DNA polymerase III delta prime subunit